MVVVRLNSQLAVSLSKIVTPVEDDCGTALKGGEDKDDGFGVKGVEATLCRCSG